MFERKTVRGKKEREKMKTESSTDWLHSSHPLTV